LEGEKVKLIRNRHFFTAQVRIRYLRFSVQQQPVFDEAGIFSRSLVLLSEIHSNLL